MIRGGAGWLAARGGFVKRSFMDTPCRRQPVPDSTCRSLTGKQTTNSGKRRRHGAPSTRERRNRRAASAYAPAASGAWSDGDSAKRSAQHREHAGRRGCGRSGAVCSDGYWIRGAKRQRGGDGRSRSPGGKRQRAARHARRRQGWKPDRGETSRQAQAPMRSTTARPGRRPGDALDTKSQTTGTDQKTSRITSAMVAGAPTMPPSTSWVLLVGNDPTLWKWNLPAASCETTT